MAQKQVERAALGRGLSHSSPSLLGILAAAAVLCVTVIFAQLLRDELPEQSLMLLFLLAVLVVSVAQGFAPGLMTSLAAFVAYNFFFVEPLYTLQVARYEDGLALAVLLVAGSTTGLLAGRMRDEAANAKARAEMLARVSRLGDRLSRTESVAEVKRLTVEHLAEDAGASALLLEPRGSALELVLAVPPDQTLRATELEAAERAFRRANSQPRTLPADNGSRYDFASLGAGHGVVGLQPGNANARFADQSGLLFRTMVQQGALAIDRVVHAEEARTAEAKATREALRSALLSSLSHDLRTPLATILGGTTSLKELWNELPAGARAELLEAIETETRRLTSYVQNLLDLTRLKSGIEIRREAVDVTDAAQSAASRARRTHPGRMIAVHAESADVIVPADAALVEQAVYNLIDNAVKYSPEDSTVDLFVTPSPSHVTVRLADRGRGIAAEDIDRIFEPFVRGRDTGVAGTGLGLAIARGIAELHRGALSVESPGRDGEGTSVRLSLPREANP
jgi:two-component system sensor histidine kinase KdpD